MRPFPYSRNSTGSRIRNLSRPWRSCGCDDVYTILPQKANPAKARSQPMPWRLLRSIDTTCINQYSVSHRGGVHTSAEPALEAERGLSLRPRQQRCSYLSWPIVYISSLRLPVPSACFHRKIDLQGKDTDWLRGPLRGHVLESAPRIQCPRTERLPSSQAPGY